MNDVSISVTSIMNKKTIFQITFKYVTLIPILYRFSEIKNTKVSNYKLVFNKNFEILKSPETRKKRHYKI